VGLRKEYLTITNMAAIEMEEKKSRFIASVKPVSNEEQALEFVQGLKAKYWDATHNVYAYYIGGNNPAQRFSDDGEPSGTAGLPVLEAIKRAGIEDAAVVVTRYFGGTLLGASGLIRAYSKSASLGIEEAAVAKRQLCSEVHIAIEYTLLGRVQSVLASRGYIIKNVIYGQDVEIIVFVFVDDIKDFIQLISDTTNARALNEIGDTVYVNVKMND